MKQQSPIYQNLSTDELIQHALQSGEGVLSSNGALTVNTGKRTGRSPKDRFIVQDEETESQIAWGAINQPISPQQFQTLWSLAENYWLSRPRYMANLNLSANPKYRLNLTVMTEFAWHQLFASCLFIRPDQTELKNDQGQEWTILNVPNLKLDPKKDNVNSDGVVVINLSQQKVLLIGMPYAGEMKKAMFTVMNYILPPKAVLPMHCAANRGEQSDVALFFGLSGTGKTTLSADPKRYLIGDDEHGWGEDGVFNFEGGCYAKCIHLTKEKEPVIWSAISKGAIMENVVLKQNNDPDYDDGSRTENTRAAYPLDHIPVRVSSSRGEEPKVVIFLSCDLYGVLPAVSVLNPSQAAYYFLSGYTALVGSTELGGTKEIVPTFSTCFGAPFFPRPATVYADLLVQRIIKSGARVYLVNTGWSSGAYGEGGVRFPLPVTRSIIDAILNNAINNEHLEALPGFNLYMPKSIPGVEEKVLNPMHAYSDILNFQTNANILIKKFCDNFEKFKVSDEIKAAGPTLIDTGE